MIICEPTFSEIADNRLFQKVERCGRVCYKSEDKITDDSAYKFVKNICSNNHGSVLEHYNFTFSLEIPFYHILKEVDIPFFFLSYDNLPLVSFNLRAFLNQYNREDFPSELKTFAYFMEITYPTLFTLNKGEKEFNIELIEDYSKLTRKERDIHQYITISLITDRGVTHELVRHRIASYSQESTRYCNYSKDKFSNQITVIKPVDLPDEGLEIWKQAMENAEKSYFDLLKVSSPQIARSVLPNSLKTEICVTASINEWKLIFELRCSTFAHPDIRYIMNKVKSYFIEKGYIDETI